MQSKTQPVKVCNQFCCRSCGRTDHKRSNNKLCPHYKGRKNSKLLEEEGKTQSMMDEIALTHQSESSVSLVRELISIEASDDDNYNLSEPDEEDPDTANQI